MKKFKSRIIATILSFSILTTGCESTQIEDLESFEMTMGTITTIEPELDINFEELDSVYETEVLEVISNQSRDIVSIIDLITAENEAIKEEIPIRDIGETVSTSNTSSSASTSNNTSGIATSSTPTSTTTSSETTSDTTSSETTSDTTSSETTSDTTSSETTSDTTSSETTSDTTSSETTSDTTSSETTSDTTSSETTSDTTSSETTSDTTYSDTTSSDTTSSVTTSSVTTSSETSSSTSSTPQNTANNPNEMRGVWISFLELQSFAGSSQAAFTTKVAGYFDTCVSMGLNTVIVQVRPHGDSIYPSDYYPWSKTVSGTMGLALSYDPLEIMISQAKSRGLSFHAWVNPYRTMTNTEMSLVSDSYLVKQWYNSANRSNYMVQVGTDSRWWLKPSNAEARQLIVNGVAEIVRKYDVDGIHFDDYFYGDNPSVYGDTSAQAKQYNSLMVKATYDAIKAINPTVQFGISPLGSFNADSSLPTSDTGYLSTDLNLWCKTSGYIDYVMPQIYWQYSHSTQPFTTVFNKWQNFVTASTVDLYIGLAPYKPEVEVESQIIDIQNSYNGDGYCLYRYDYIHGLKL